MIKINLNKAIEILEFHYQNLTSGNQNILDLLQNKIDATSDEIQEMYQELKSNVELNNGFSILTAKPDELHEFAEKFEKEYADILDSRMPKTSSEKQTTFRENLLKVFYYKSYSKWKAYELANKIDVKVCPYCNRNYTFVLGSDKNKGTRFQFDHFMKKSHYTYLALSFYNLVPSCKVCNSDLKGEKPFLINSHIHPYEQGFGNELTFSVLPNKASFTDGGINSFRIRFQRNTKDIDKFKAMYANVRVFKLLKLYNMHKDYVNEIILKSKVYTPQYMEDLHNNFPDLFTSTDAVKHIVLGNYISETDLGKRPLAKLTRDIARELGLL